MPSLFQSAVSLLIFALQLWMLASAAFLLWLWWDSWRNGA